MKFLMIRHGIIRIRIIEVREGIADVPLNELGIEQAKHLAHCVAKLFYRDFKMGEW